MYLIIESFPTSCHIVLYGFYRGGYIKNDMSIYSTLYKKMIKLGAHIYHYTYLTRCIAHPLRKPNTVTCQQMRNTGKNPSVVLSTLVNGLCVILLVRDRKSV